jgi:DNA-binding beta-propeller fold protein YncE
MIAGLVVVFAVACADARAAGVGALVQLAAPNDCLEQDSSILSVGAEGCGTTDAWGLLGASAMTVAPDGRDAYVVTGENVSGLAESSSVVELRRDAASGALSEFGCISRTGAECDLKADGLREDDEIVSSPDGTRVYVGSPSAGLDVFARAADGSLSLIQCFKRTSDPDPDAACTTLSPDLEGVRGIAVSADGHNVYAAEQNGNAIAIFTRSASNTLEYNGCVSQLAEGGNAGCVTTGVTGLLGVTGLAVSPGGERLYAVSYSGNALVTFKRNTTTGMLEYQSCESGSSGAKLCAVTSAGGLSSAQNVVVSPDGSRIYVVSLDGGLATFAPAASGTMEVGCLSASGAEPACTPAGASLSGGIDLVLDPAAAPGAGALYTTSFFTDAVNAFSIDPTSGLPVPLSGADACVQASGSSAGCAVTSHGLNEAAGIATSPDGQNIYVASRGEHKVQCGASKCTDTVSAIAAFARAPVPAPPSAGSTGGGSTTGSGGSPISMTPAPALAHLRLTRATIHRKGHKGTSTQLTYTDTEAATTTLTIELQQTGVRKHNRCVHGRAHAKRSACRLYSTFTTIVHNDVAGSNTLKIGAQIGRHKLPVGRYLLVLVARAASGQSDRTSIGLRVV